MELPDAKQTQSDAENSPQPRERATAALTPASILSIAPIVPDYELIRRIGGGSYGDVWLARSKATGVFRAAKIVWRRTFEDDRPFQREFEGIQRFERISREHPSQLALFHVGRNDAEGYFYYVMELADSITVGDDVRSLASQKSQARTLNSETNLEPPHVGSYAPHTLRAELQHGRLPAERVLEIGLVLTEALGHLHNNGLVHRDVKPSNVIFVNGRPKLADIGLVTDASDQCSIVGTEGYLPPEGPGTPQADIFALGKVIYEAATGRDRRDFPDLPPDIRDWPDAKQVFELNEVFLKACDNDPRHRYASATKLREDLVLLQLGQSVKRKRAWRRRIATCGRVGLVVVASALLAVVGVLVANRRHVELGRSPILELGDLTKLPPEEDVRSSIPEVNDLIVQGQFCVRTISPDQLRRARSYFNQAIKLDSNSVAAYWGLFQAGISGGSNAHGAPGEETLDTIAVKLTELAPSYAESRVASSLVKWVDWDFKGALADARMATHMRAASNEGRTGAHSLYGWYLSESGNPAGALVEYQMAENLNPSQPILHHHLGHPYFVWRQFDKAMKYYQESIDLVPSHPSGHYFKGRIFEETTNFMAAIQEFEVSDLGNGMNEADIKPFYAALRKAANDGGGTAYWNKRLELGLKKSPQDLYYIATLYARLGDKDQAYSYLRQACDKKAFDQGLMFDLCWDHNDPTFQAIARGIGLLQ